MVRRCSLPDRRSMPLPPRQLQPLPEAARAAHVQQADEEQAQALGEAPHDPSGPDLPEPEAASHAEPGAMLPAQLFTDGNGPVVPEAESPEPAEQSADAPTQAGPAFEFFKKEKFPAQLLPPIASFLQVGEVRDFSLALEVRPRASRLYEDMPSPCLESHQVRGYLDSIRQSKLQALACCPDRITDQELCDLAAKCPQLRELFLDGERPVPGITVDGWEHVSRMTQLDRLDLDYPCAMSDAGLKHLSKLERLQHLFIWDCSKVTDEGVRQLSQLRNLRHLYLQLRNSTGFVGHGLAGLASLAQLEHLTLRDCLHLTDEGLSHLPPLPALRTLGLENSPHITLEGVIRVASSAPHVERLKLRWCELIDGDLRQLFAVLREHFPSLAKLTALWENGSYSAPALPAAPQAEAVAVEEQSAPRGLDA